MNTVSHKPPHLNQLAARAARSEAAAVIIESAIAVTLMAIIILGFAQLYAITNDRLEHVKLATEMLMGPQERSLDFDTAGATFSRLGNTTTPTLDEFMDALGAFFESRADEGDVLHAALLYIGVDNSTGFTTQVYGSLGGVGATSSVYTYPASASGDCVAAGIQDDLLTYASNHITAIHDYISPVSGTKVEIGTKLYDISVGGTRYKEYVDFIPMLYMTICSEPQNYLFPQLALSTFEFVPRKLIS